jgi:hypothetical protein
MSDVAPQAEDIEQALGYLRMLWGDEFIIGHDEQGYWAHRRGEVGGLMRAASPDELGEKMNGSAGSGR